MNLPIEYRNNLEDAINDADVIVLVTRWPEFQSIPALLAGKKKQPLVVDGRRMLDSGSIERYTGIGM